MGVGSRDEMNEDRVKEVRMALATRKTRKPVAAVDAEMIVPKGAIGWFDLRRKPGSSLISDHGTAGRWVKKSLVTGECTRASRGS